MAMMQNIMNVRADVALLIARLITGGIFIVAGWTKVADMDTMVAMFAQIGIPAFLTYIVSYGELVGGFLLVLGLKVRHTAAFLAVIMVVAVAMNLPMGFGVYSLPLSMLSGLVAIMGLGSGRCRVRIPVRADGSRDGR